LSILEQYQKEFIELALRKKALQFGSFTLKSGRVSPYFFNSGLFNSGNDLAVLGKCYANAIINKCDDFDVVFGPAYKGIPLVAAASIALATEFRRDTPFCFNRKEPKDHGEGGLLVGSPLRGRVLIIDDVITAGTAVNEALKIVAREGGQVIGVIVGLDRKERGQNNLSAAGSVENDLGIKVTSIIDIDDILDFIGENPEDRGNFEKIKKYQDAYGI
jgi:orotate phosphoribosyltransferase